MPAMAGMIGETSEFRLKIPMAFTIGRLREVGCG